MPKVSVIIPIYNSMNYILPLMEDLFAQTYTDAEYILVNDGSTDSSLEVINDFVCRVKDNRYRVVSQANSGVSAARNKGLSLATGEYIIFVDSDDRLNKHFLESYVNAIVSNETDIEIFSFIKIDDHESLNSVGKVDCSSLEKEGKFDGSMYLKYLASGLVQGYPFMYIFKSSLWKQIRFDTKLNYQEDLFAILQIIINTPNLSIHANSRSYYYYYIRDDSAARSIAAKTLKSVVDMDLKTIEQASSSKNVNISRRIINQILVISYWKMLVLSVWQDDRYFFEVAKEGFIEYVPKTSFTSKKDCLKRWEQYILLRLGLDNLVRKILNK